jgi:hypothetical protein
LRITITTKAKSYGKSKLFSQNIVDCYSVSPQGFFFPLFLCFLFWYHFIQNYLCQFYYYFLSWL